MSLALARALIVSELVPRARMGRLLALAVRQSKSLAVILAEEDEELVLAALAKDPTPLVPDIEIDRAVLARLPAELPERLGIAPLTGYSEANLVAVAMMDPTDRHAALEVERILRTSIMRVRVRPLLLRRALMEVGSMPAPFSHDAPQTLSDPPRAQPSAPPRVTLGPGSGSQRPLGPGEYRLDHPGFALLGMPVVTDSDDDQQSTTPPAIRTPPFGSLSMPVLAHGRPATEPDEDEEDETDEEPIPLVRKASAPFAPQSPRVQTPYGPGPVASWRDSSPVSPPSIGHTASTNPVPASVRHARTLAPPPSMSAPPPSFSPRMPQPVPAPPAPSVLPPRPPRSITPTAIPSVGLHAFTRMSLEEYSTRLGMLRTAKHRDDVTGELLTLAHAVAEQAIVLATKGERYTGWSGSLSLGNVRALEISAREPTVFTRAALEDGFLGQLVPMPAHRELLEMLHGHALDPVPAPLEVAVWPVVVAKRPVLFLLAAKLTDPLVATQRFSEMCRAASQGLYRLLRGGR